MQGLPTGTVPFVAPEDLAVEIVAELDALIAAGAEGEERSAASP